MKSFTIGELADAIEKNGYKQGFNSFFKTANGHIANHIETLEEFKPLGYKIGEACALGQAAINLGINNHNWRGNLNFLELLRNQIAHDNDKYHKTPAQIAEHIRLRFPNNLDSIIEAAEFDYTPFLEDKPE